MVDQLGLCRPPGGVGGGDLEAARQLLDEAVGLEPACREMAAKDDDLKPLFNADREGEPKAG